MKNKKHQNVVKNNGFTWSTMSYKICCLGQEFTNSSIFSGENSCLSHRTGIQMFISKGLR